jgi:magnesium-transporting ATPase (P-type)
LVGIVVPPRPTARASIATAKKAGIRVRTITGDYAVTAAATARQLGIDGTVLTGAEFAAMSDEEALAKVDGIGVIAGLMDRPPLPPARPILTRGLIVWLSFAGLLMATGTLGVISGADQAHGLAAARTMGMVTFALFLLFFSIESKDEPD